MFLIALVRALQIAATALALGGAAFDLLVLRPALSPWNAGEIGPPTRRWLRALGLVAIVLGAVSWCAWLADVAIGMSGLPAAQALRWGVLHPVLAQTTFGHVWIVRAGLWTALLLVWLAGRARPAGIAHALIGTALAASLAWTGHAAAAGSLQLLVDAGHLCGAALWLGMLPPLAWLASRACRSERDEWASVAAAAALRFSLPGAFAVLLLVVTGIANALWLVGSWSDLFSTGYGRQLIGKIALFAAMLVLAFVNRWLLAPRMNRSVDARERHAALARLRSTVFAEALLGAAVLVVVGSLGVSAPSALGRNRHDHMSELHKLELRIS